MLGIRPRADLTVFQRYGCGMTSAYGVCMSLRVNLLVTLLWLSAWSPRALAEDLSPAAVARRSMLEPAGAFELDRHTRSQRSRPGYGLAAGLGIAVSGLIVAAQARPNVEWGNLCYDDPVRERRFLYVSTAVMAGGLALAGGMLVRLLHVRAAHPDARPSRGARWGQALLGIGTAAAVTTSLMLGTVGCASS
ncbi:MAG: hypothetical protein JWN04_6029 [Myxococcaceae bacterium]|nr:hypothetical protein [Myxococcaceae bacterium]